MDVAKPNDGHTHMWRPLLLIDGWFNETKVIEACVLCDLLECHCQPF